MKKLFCLLSFVLLFCCTDVTYLYEAQIDYSIYQTAYLEPFYLPDKTFSYMDEAEKEYELTRLLLDKLEEKSDFIQIETDSAFMDSMDCKIVMADYPAIDLVTHNDNKVEIGVVLRYKVYNSNDRMILSFTVKVDNSENIDEGNVISNNEAVDDLMYKTLREAIDKVSSEFLRDLEI